LYEESSLVSVAATTQESPAKERDELEAKYAPLIREQLEWGRYVTYVPNKGEPVYGWYRFKEAFSRRLVEEMLTSDWHVSAGDLVFDPFAGCGTTLLACQELGYPAIGVDVMPLSVFVTRVKLSARELTPERLKRAVHRVLTAPYRAPAGKWPDVNIVDLAFDLEAREQLLFFRERILETEEPAIRDFLMLALLATLEETSFTSKDGQFLRIVKRKPKPVRTAFGDRLARMIQDLDRQRLTRGNGHGHQSRVFLGDARNLPQEVREHAGSVSAVVTSPPYLNRYDYSRTYSLELCLLWDDSNRALVETFDDLKRIRHSLLRSHIESRAAPTDQARLPQLTEILSNLRDKNLNNPRIPVMIHGYFEDMNLAIQEMSAMLRPGAHVALVVANARFEGEMVPVDLMLSELAARHGLATEEIRVTRYKGNSSQQMGRYGRVPVRESVCFWHKRA
jgi:hypothetical protein